MRILLILFSFSFAIREVVIPCDADTYASLGKPDMNYGTSNTLVGSNAYTMKGNKYTAFDVSVIYLHFPIPKNLAGKITVLAVGQYYYIESIKAKSPYGKASIYTAELEQLTKSWDESTLTMNNAPDVIPPFFYDADSASNTYSPKAGWNKFILNTSGLNYIQGVCDNPATNYGMGMVFSIFPPASETVAKDGVYVHQITLSSRETIRNAPKLILQYDWKTGIKPALSEIQTSSLGEIRGNYK